MAQQRLASADTPLEESGWPTEFLLAVIPRNDAPLEGLGLY